MSEPAWIPLGGQGVDYKGDWAAGTAYAPGDVVRVGGVDYLAVNPSTGQTPPASLYSHGQPACRAYRLNQLIPNTASTVITLDGGEHYDTDGMHDLVTTPSRIICRTPGIYLIIGYVEWAVSATGVWRQIILRHGVSGPVAQVMQGPVQGGNFTQQSVSSVWNFAVNEYVELVVSHDSGAGGLNITVATLAMTRLA